MKRIIYISLFLFFICSIDAIWAYLMYRKHKSIVLGNSCIQNNFSIKYSYRPYAIEYTYYLTNRNKIMEEVEDFWSSCRGLNDLDEFIESRPPLFTDYMFVKYYVLVETPTN